MKAKELRQAAESLSNDAARYLEEYLAEEHDDAVSFAHFERVDLVTDHILATVREDDDELVDELWFIKQTRVDGPLLNMIVLVCRSEGFHLKVNGNESDRPATRGDFRALCRLLGVKLKEDE